MLTYPIFVLFIAIASQTLNTGLSDAEVSKKMRLLALASLFAKQPVLDFSALAATLQVPVDEIESWVIDGG